LDLGRELFANVTSLAVFVVPPGEKTAPAGGPPIPDAALVITVNDPSKSEALWKQLLGIVGLATGSPSIEGTPVQIEGSEVRTFKMPGGVTTYLAVSESDVILSPSETAVGKALRAKRSGANVLKDPVFAESLARVGNESTKAVLLHPGRCAGVARKFVPPNEFAQVEPFLPLLDKTVVSMVVDHSGETLRFSGQVTGIPNVGGLVAGFIEKEKAGGQTKRQVREAVKTKKWDDSLFKRLENDAKGLNNAAWEILTDEKCEDEAAALALRFAERSNELTNYSSWVFLDTLALAKFKTGDAQTAVELQRKAIELSGGQSAEVLKGRLARFEAALRERKNVSGSE
jgi:hypothetical protein